MLANGILNVTLPESKSRNDGFLIQLNVTLKGYNDRVHFGQSSEGRWHVSLNGERHDLKAGSYTIDCNRGEFI